jgi:hypothetical protein
MMTAWGVFVEADAWGDFEINSFSRVLRSAGWPKGVRPYNLRHTVGIALSESGADLSDVQAQMGHKRISTTREHYVPVLGSRMQTISEGIDGRIGWGESRIRESDDDRGRGGDLNRADTYHYRGTTTQKRPRSRVKPG